MRRAAVLGGTATAVVALSACTALGIAEPTEVPGAAATLARSAATAMATPPPKGPSSPLALSPSPVRSPSPVVAQDIRVGISNEEVDALKQRLEEVFANQDLPGAERILAERVSVATPEGSEILSRDSAVRWLQDRAQPGLTVTRVDRSALAVALQAESVGWQPKPAGTQGRLRLVLHRYDQSGEQSQDRGEWKVDVATVD